MIDALLFSNVGSEWRNRVWRENQHDGAFFQTGFYPLETAINPFWAIREGMELYARDSGLEDYVEPKSGRTVQVWRDIHGPMPADSLYTTIFEQKVQGHDLLGLSCYMPDWRIPGHAAEQERKAKLDELFESLV